MTDQHSGEELSRDDAIASILGNIPEDARSATADALTEAPDGVLHRHFNAGTSDPDLIHADLENHRLAIAIG